MTRFEQDYYNDISSIEKSLKRIADALEKGNNKEGKIYYKTRKDMFMDNPCTKEEYEASKNIPGFEGTLDALDNLCNVGTNPKNDPERDKFEDDDLSIRYKKNDGPLLWPNCPDLDIRKSARMYNSELTAGNFNTKKECILDYVTNEFGSQGAKYTDIIKFAYYLNNANGPKFGYSNRGYYSCALSQGNTYVGPGHLVTGGKDQLVKGVNKDGDERYFALSFVESVTDYWKYLDR